MQLSRVKRAFINFSPPPLPARSAFGNQLSPPRIACSFIQQILLNVDRECPLKNIALAAALSLLLLAGVAAQAQLDVAFGVNTVTSPSAVVSSSTGNVIESLGRGAYLGFSGDYLFLLHHSFGVGGEIFWRATQANYGGSQPYRPLFYDFNGVFAPRLTTLLYPLSDLQLCFLHQLRQRQPFHG
jgi:hypothetical protein